MRPFGLAALRWCVGIVFIAHGAQKLFGLWGGPGLAGTAAFLGSLSVPLAYPMAIVLALTEFGGGLLLVAGALTAWTSMALAIDMLVAIWKVHAANGFFASGGASSRGPGIEYPLVLLAALVCLMLSGAGALSLDEWRTQSAEAKAFGRARARSV